MSDAPAYAGTSVEVSKSQSEVRKLLQKHGASEFTFGESTAGPQTLVGVEFVSGPTRIRLRVPLKTPAEDIIARKARRARTKTAGEIRAEENEAEARRIWRVIAWGIKARLVAVEEDVETLEQAFLPHVVLSNGATIYENLVHTGQVSLDEGQQLLLPPGN